MTPIRCDCSKQAAITATGGLNVGLFNHRQPKNKATTGITDDSSNSIRTAKLKKDSFRTGIEGGIVLSVERIAQTERHYPHAQNKNRFKSKLKP